MKSYRIYKGAKIINDDRTEISEQHIANMWRAGGQWPYTAVNLSDGSFIIVYDDKNGVVAQKFDYEGNRIGDVSDFSFAKRARIFSFFYPLLNALEAKSVTTFVK